MPTKIVDLLSACTESQRAGMAAENFPGWTAFIASALLDIGHMGFIVEHFHEKETAKIKKHVLDWAKATEDCTLKINRKYEKSTTPNAPADDKLVTELKKHIDDGLAILQEPHKAVSHLKTAKSKLH
jgi:hypothetical protein